MQKYFHPSAEKGSGRLIEIFQKLDQAGYAIGVWICGCRIFCKGGSKGGYRGGSIRLKLELGTFSQAKVNKVLNLDLQFFVQTFLANYEKNLLHIMFISRQDQKCVLIEFMHYPKQDKYDFHQDTFLILS